MKMVKESLIAGIDVGSNQVCCVVGALDEEQKLVKILSGAISQCSDGIKSGAVIDIQEASNSMKRAYLEAEKTASGQIDAVIVSMRGNFIEAHNVKGVANIPNKEVDEFVINEALASARESMKLENGKEVLQIAPKEFFLDQQRVQNPIKMDGNIIEIEALSFVASSTNIVNILKTMSLSDIECADKIYSYMAASEILLRKEEKESGCLLIDFGALTTGIVYYEDGILRYTDELPVGSEHVTKDLMHKLRVSHQEAEKIKIEHGAAFCFSGFEDREFSYREADGVTEAKANRREIVEGVILPRMDQIFLSIINKMQKRPNPNVPNIILTGGGSKLQYITRACEKCFEDFRPFVRIGFPLENKIVGPREIVLNQSYASAIGAIYCEFSNPYSSGVSKQQRDFGKFASKVKTFFKEIF
jgi:cell division protein FtsA